MVRRKVKKKFVAAAIATGLVLSLGTAGLASAQDKGRKTESKTERVADRVAKEALIASIIGLDAATIKSRLRAGETLAAIAGSKTAALIAALVAAKTNEIDAAVTSGKLTAAKATTLKTNLTAHITAKVNQVRGPGMGKVKGKGHGMGKGHGRP
jgi:hypothetical protein